MNLFKKKIELGLFNEASNCSENLSEKEISNLIFELGSSENISVYAFVCFKVLNEDIWKWHHRAAILLFWYFTHIGRSTAGANAHIEHSLIKEPTNIEILECLLHTYELPFDPFEPKEINIIAQQVLLLKPESEIAQRVIELTKDHLNNHPWKHILPTEREGQFCWLVSKGKLFAANTIAQNFDTQKLFYLLDRLAIKENICAYVFVWHMLWIKETAQLHLYAAQIFQRNFLKKFPEKPFPRHTSHGTPAVVFFHTHRAAELEPDNLEIQEQLLSLYEPGNESFDLEETKALVEHMLKINPESAEGLRVQKLIF